MNKLKSSLLLALDTYFQHTILTNDKKTKGQPLFVLSTRFKQFYMPLFTYFIR